MELKQIMAEEWESVRRDYFYPQLPQPRMIDGVDNAYLDMRDWQIEVGEDFIEDFAKNGIQQRDSLNEVLTHELTHYLKYPGSPLTIFKKHKVARQTVDEMRAGIFEQMYSEIQVNLHMTQQKMHPSTIPMRRIKKPFADDKYGNLLYGVLQEIWGTDIGVKLDQEQKELIKGLKRINYLDKENEMRNFHQFVRTLENYSPQFMSRPMPGGFGSGGLPSDQNSEGYSIDMFSDDEIKEAMRKFAKECASSEEFRNIVKEVMKQAGSMRGGGAGCDKADIAYADDFYTLLAENFSVPIRKKPMKGSGSLYPHSQTAFNIDDPIGELNPYSSPRLMPGISKRWVRKEGGSFCSEEKVPNEAIIIDNSGSMPDPIWETSIPVLGATAIADAYLNAEAKVAVYTFGGADVFTDFTRDRKTVHEAVRVYTGGGTMFSLEYMEKVLKASEEEFDVSVVSDMMIYNLDEFITGVLRIPKTHRIHLINAGGYDPWSHDERYTKHLQKRFGNCDNVAIVTMDKESDIEKITMGELKKSII